MRFIVATFWRESTVELSLSTVICNEPDVLRVAPVGVNLLTCEDASTFSGDPQIMLVECDGAQNQLDAIEADLQYGVGAIWSVDGVPTTPLTATITTLLIARGVPALDAASIAAMPYAERVQAIKDLVTAK